MKPPFPDQEMAVVRAIVYASLFDYPLTPAQIVESLEGVEADELRVRAWLARGPLLASVVESRDGYCFPSGQGHLVEVRQRREAASRDMLAGHSLTIRLIASLPFVRSVCLSGSLAHLNGTPAADLDLFIVTAPGRVWAVTTTVLALARLLGRRRALCLNYVVSERHLALQPADAFAANQLMHLQPVSGVAVYRRLLEANPFVARFYPNFRGRDARPIAGRDQPSTLRRATEAALSIGLAPIYERLCRWLYGRHLQARASTWESPAQVQLEVECLKLHTHSHRSEIAERFDRAMAACLEHQELRVAK